MENTPTSPGGPVTGIAAELREVAEVRTRTRRTPRLRNSLADKGIGILADEEFSELK